MDQPSQLFDRIRRLKARPDLPRPRREAPAPASIGHAAYRDAPAPAPIRTAAPMPARSEAPAPAQPEAPVPTPAAEPPHPAPSTPPARGHALYSQVMRSHDRMGTRHV